MKPTTSLSFMHTIMTVPFLCAFCGCFGPPRVGLTVTHKQDEMELNFSTKGINGFLGLEIWEADTKQLLWSVSLSYYNGQRLVYGEVPHNFKTFNGNTHSADQGFPKDENVKPAPLKPNSRVYVSIDCQYDSGFSASVRSFEFLLETDDKAHVAKVTPVKIKPEDRPERLEESSEQPEDAPNK